MTNNHKAGSPVVAVTGSLAYDLIMDYPGNFKDHILPDKLHVINVSFLVGDLKKQQGGCAANISYTMSLLKTPARVVAAAGKDFDEYADWLRAQGIDTSGIQIFPDEVTASCYITSDHANNQITGFHPGAMKRASEISLKNSVPEGVRFCIVAPDDPDAMIRHCQEAREIGLKVLFDPSFQVVALDGDRLMQGASGCYAVVMNDYEYALFLEKTGRTREQLLEVIDMIIVTYGPKGCQIYLRSGETLDIPAAEVEKVVDPTGAGDAFRGGLLVGLVQDLDLTICARMGSVASAYAIENYGTQNFHYTPEDFWKRYEENYGPVKLPALQG